MRRGYRYWHAGVGESVVFPLELSLGLDEGVSPALQERIAKQMAEAGATQDRVLQWIRSEHEYQWASNGYAIWSQVSAKK